VYYVKEKKFIIGLVLFVVGITTFFWLSQKTTVFDAPPSAEDEILTKLSELQKDSDGDGMKDWEEELVGTDPYDPDSVIENFRERGSITSNENIFGENNSYQYTSAEEEKNLTESVAQELFGGFLATSQSDSSEEEKEDLVTGLIEDILAPKRDVYSSSDVATIQSNPETLRSFGNDLAYTLSLYPRVSIENLLELFQEVLDKNIPSSLQAMEDQSKLYKNLATDITLLSIPDTLSSSLITLANAYHKTGESILAMSNVNRDGVRALTGLNLYQENIGTARQILILFADTFDKEGVIFNIEDTGFIWKSI